VQVNRNVVDSLLTAGQSTFVVGRNPSLDVLRSLAIFLVLGFHVPYYHAWATAGWIGVDLFFVLSGFLISGLLFREFQATGAINFWRFILRRGLKIWPPFYFLLATTAFLLLLTHHLFPTGGVIANALFVQNYFFGPSKWHLGLMGHSWSLAVEEHFYLLLPVFLMGLMASRKGRADPFSAIPYLFIPVCVVCLALRYFLQPPGVYRIVAPTHMRIDSLFAGVTLGYLYHFRPRWFAYMTGHYALVVTFLCCLPAVFFSSWDRRMQTIGLTSLFVGFSFLLAWAIDRKPRSPVGMAVMQRAARIGEYSYSIYLWHWILSLVFIQAKPTAMLFWSYIALSLAVGIVISRLVEMPALALRNRILPVSPARTVSPFAGPGVLPSRISILERY
jgi:peptidoglycan/LPS O-acetylase OafA/YrhL